MLGNLFKKQKPAKPELNFIQNYKNKDLFFIRTNPWGWLNKEEIYLPKNVDGKPTMITFDFWSQEIYLDATGQITVRELIEIACKQYNDSGMDIPEGIDQILVESLESLVYELKVVEFSEIKRQLPKDIEEPIA
ncbi:hypothetical protein ACMA1I_19265 [Pontibacter sp. 13R65]|uniref:hypothetical protein n=1 Tax=Pontibacter sp. 13R65 TaxID=3127458 RepID=UPI00301E4132